MIVEYNKSFLKSIDKIRDSDLNTKIENFIIEYENVFSVHEIKNTKKLTGYKIITELGLVITDWDLS